MKSVLTIWQSLKENVEFLVTYHTEKQRLRAEEIELKQQCQLQELALWMSLNKSARK